MNAHHRLAPALGAALLVPLTLGAAPPAIEHASAFNTYHGVQVEDRYRWLEPADDAQVREWTAQQNSKTRSYLDALPGRDALARQLQQLSQRDDVRDGGFKPAGGRLFATTSEPKRQQPRISVLDGSGDPSSRRVVFDPATLDPKGRLAIDWFQPSPDGRLLAVSLSPDGSENGTLHVVAVDDGREIESPIPDVQYPTGGGALAWAPDSSGFWYTRYPGPAVAASEPMFNQELRYHRLGAASADDALVLGAADGLPRTAEIFLDNRVGARVALASVELGDGGQYRHYLVDTTHGTLAADYDAGLKSAALVSDDSIVGVSVADKPNGTIVRYAARGSGFARSTIVAPGVVVIQTDTVHGSLVVSGDRLFYTSIDGGPSLVRSIGLDGTRPAMLRTPLVTAAHLATPLPGGDLLYRVEGYLAPTVYRRWSAREGRSIDTPIPSRANYDTSGFEVRRAFARSKDGTRVPFTVIVPKGFVADGSAPAVLSGYGGFGLSQSPSFVRPANYQFLKAGGIVAIANLRGGGEYGEAWHRAGMLTRKQAVFDDFAAVAQALVDQRFTSSDKLALRGGSNGGLLMGAVLTQNPGLAKAVISTVGLYDMVRFETGPNGSFNTSEYGSVADADQFKALYAYSPLHHVTPGVRYPAVLLATGDLDGRVDPMHSRKFAAALEDAGDAKVYLRTSATAGHGIGSSLGERQGLEVDLQAFLFDQLGMVPPKE